LAIRKIELNYPGESSCEVRASVSFIPLNKNLITIYDTVAFFEKEIFPKIKNRLKRKKIKRRFSLPRILNIHNDDGIKDLTRIIRMAKDITLGKHILSFGVPNIKLVKTIDNRLLLFDGHHSVLAYMASGSQYLEELPHLIITDKEKGYIDDKDITIFFGEHPNEIVNHEWRRKVINWQAPKEKQLCERIQNDMGELFYSIKTRINITLD
jgi:hypothetical protein